MAGHKAEQAQDGAEEEEGNEGGIDGLLHFIVLVGAEIAADDYGGAYATADGDADEDGGQGVGGTYGGQGLLADVAADDGGVYGVIELLEEVAQDHGQGKDEQCLQGHVRYQVISFHDWSRP